MTTKNARAKAVKPPARKVGGGRARASKLGAPASVRRPARMRRRRPRQPRPSPCSPSHHALTRSLSTLSLVLQGGFTDANAAWLKPASKKAAPPPSDDEEEDDDDVSLSDAATSDSDDDGKREREGGGGGGGDCDPFLGSPP